MATESAKNVRTVEREVPELIAGDANAESRALTVELSGVWRIVYTEAATEVGIDCLARFCVSTVQMLMVAPCIVAVTNVEPGFHGALIVIEAPDVGDTPVSFVIAFTPADVAVVFPRSERRS